MNLKFDVNDTNENKQVAFESISRIDKFFVKNFEGFRSTLKDNNIQTVGQYESFLSSDPSVEIAEKSRLKGAVSVMKDIKAFFDTYEQPHAKMSATDYSEIREALSVERFIQDTGITIQLESDSIELGSGSINVNVASPSGVSKDIKLPYAIEWNDTNAKSFDGEDISVTVGSLVLLGSEKLFPSLAKSLSNFSFTKDQNIGLDSNTGYSVSDLNDKNILMKADLLDNTDTMELLGYATRNYQRQNSFPSQNLSL